MKKEDIYIGQTFVAINPDYYVLDETWQVAAMDDSDITFDVMKYWLRDAAYVEISSTDIMRGKFFIESPQGVVFTFPSEPGYCALPLYL